MNNNRLLTQGTGALNTAASNIRNLAENFLDRYTAFFKEVEGDLSTNWVGSGSKEFIDKVTEMRPKYQQMYQLMNEYAAFIDHTAKLYDEQADTIASGAKGLSFE
ncbi:MAG: WXG100 family type VII secretion target [Oscillospiraceae bacterium]|nr:WXG100 family type VII secretion target [Oscillospiraceae bacterium]MBQ9982945.1 WXG100 family type VII secretion target [Oscillospiraceae bacterium]